MEENKEEKKEEFVCYSTGEVFTDPVDVDMCKCNQNDVVINNLLLGNFTSDGKYLIDKEFLLALVKVEKKVVERFENKFVLSAWLKNEIELKFTLIVEALDEFKRTATLRFVEFLTNETYEKEALRTIVARYHDDADQYFLEKVFKVFNIKKSEDYGKDVDEEEYLNLITRYKNALLLKEKRVSLLDEISKNYVEFLLALFKSLEGKAPEFFLRKYAEIIENLKDLEGKSGYYIKLKLLVDQILKQTVKHLDNAEVKKLIDKAKMDYVEQYKTLDGKILEEVLPKPKPKAKETVKSASSESGGAKKAKKKAKAKAKSASKAGGAKAVVKKRELYVEDFIRNKGKDTIESEKPKSSYQPLDVKEKKDEFFKSVINVAIDRIKDAEENKAPKQNSFGKSFKNQEMEM